MAHANETETPSKPKAMKKRNEEASRQWKALFGRFPKSEKAFGSKRKNGLVGSEVSCTKAKKHKPAAGFKGREGFNNVKEKISAYSDPEQRSRAVRTNSPPPETVVAFKPPIKDSKSSAAKGVWKNLLDGSGPRRGSASMRLFKENKILVAAAKSAGFWRHTSVVDYDTIKDKHNPKLKKYGIAPKALSQWHWFFVATKSVFPIEKRNDALKFTLKFDKFQLAQGKCTDMGKSKGKQIYSYGCDGVKQLETAARKKKAFILQTLEDTHEIREKRLKHAQAHKEGMVHRGRATMRFVDLEGKEVFYSGMPIGGEHDWDYHDCNFIERALECGREKKWKATCVRWREVKVHQGRWAIFVGGELHSSEPMGNLKRQDYLLVADQMATKLSPVSYRVELKGIQVLTDGENETSGKETLRAIASELSKT
eukprot:CAMPEP_0184497530 /NCGR_PEP_ID=MMETSP0113_2-20130426/36795_1 /TAXON_ID=91329 /ORGANISM="Norrisiella sphaerica, Strain BC52" /LENGTH=423 /DNA_ID=CAMNT_0026884671 /DNA_START=31 /DNA_END=1302 /DNA_ORIENTATION=+